MTQPQTFTAKTLQGHLCLDATGLLYASPSQFWAIEVENPSELRRFIPKEIRYSVIPYRLSCRAPERTKDFRYYYQ